VYFQLRYAIFLSISFEKIESTISSEQLASQIPGLWQDSVSVPQRGTEDLNVDDGRSSIIATLTADH
jgi:hypothetical protein